MARKKDKQDNTFGRRLRVLREKAGLTQTELAARLDITQATLSRYELGTQVPSWYVGVRIAKALDVDLEDMEDSPLPPEPPSAD